MKKLFTTILMMTVALVTWGQDATETWQDWSGGTYKWDESSGTLTVKYTGGEFDLKDLDGPGKAWHHAVQTLVLDGPFTNAQWTGRDGLDDFVKKCADRGQGQSEPINLDLSACTSLVSKVNTSADYLSSQYSYYYSNETQPEDVTKSTIWVDENGNEYTGDRTEETVDGQTKYYYLEWYIDGAPVTNNNSYLITNLINNGSTGSNGSWNADRTAYTYYEWWNSEDQHGTSHVITFSKKYVTQQDVWKKANGTIVDASLVTVDPSDPTKGTIQSPVTGTEFKFDKCKNVLKGIVFPNSANFLAIPDRLCSPEVCPNLETVSFNNTQIEWIGAYAFGSYGQNAQDQKQSKIGNVVFPTTLKVIGADAFKNCTQFTTVDLSQLTNLVKIDYAAFNMGDDSWNSLTTVLLPSGSNLRFFGNQVFSSSHVETLDFSNCTGIRYFAYGGQNEFGEGIKTEGTSSVATFYWHNYLKTLILPPTLELIGGGGSENEIVTKNCGLLEDIVFTGTRTNNDLVIGSYAFAKTTSLTNVTFSPNLVKIATMSFSQDINLNTVDLAECHRLTLIEDKAFNECSTEDKTNGIITVRLCSHPKVIQATGGHGTGAFNNTKTIRTVEVVACDGTYADECICQQGAFDFDVTNVQTQIESVDVAARLIYPRNLPVRGTEGYTSAYDFFVGDYKSDSDGGSCIITQDNLQSFYKTVPCESTNGMAQLAKKQAGFPEWVGGARYYGNGWLEFINTGDAEIIPEGEFLRTYSRSVDTGVTLLPAGITAYRALDYKSELSEYVATAKGDYVNINEKTGGEPDYQLYSTMGAADKTKYKKYKRYALLTVKGKIMLKALRPVHQYMDTSTGEVITEEDNTRSYVPEGTGVVLYSTTLNEDKALLIFGNNYSEIDYLFPQYPHTEGRYEQQRLEAIATNNTDINWNDDINMLQGSYDQECLVAPVLPWDWDNNIFFADNKQYRNFGFSKSAAGGQGGWVRLQPGQLRLNRAFAKIPAGRFNNFNESTDQMPEFYLEDRVATSSGVNTICVLGFSFDEDMTDGIQTIGTAAQTYEKDAWYTLQGVKVTNPTKGIYIHNNKKVVIK